MNTPSARRGPRRIVFASLILALLGLAVSAELSRLHLRVHTDPAHQSWCRVGETVNCEVVERSAYAVFAGAPVAAWGVLGYLILLGVALSGLLGRGATSWPRGALLLFGGLFSIVSLENAAISFGVLHALCLLCAASYLVNLTLLVLAVVGARRSGLGVLGAVRADLAALLRRWPLTATATAASIVAALALSLGYPAYWKQGPQLPGGSDGLATGLTRDGAPWIGADAPVVTLIEFSDYESPGAPTLPARPRLQRSPRPTLPPPRLSGGPRGALRPEAGEVLGDE